MHIALQKGRVTRSCQICIYIYICPALAVSKDEPCDESSSAEDIPSSCSVRYINAKRGSVMRIALNPSKSVIYFIDSFLLA